MPNTTKVLRPHTVEDLALALGADLEQLIEDLFWIWGFIF